MKFKPGQKVICVSKGSWIKGLDFGALSFWNKIRVLLKGNKICGPRYNDIVTVDRLDGCNNLPGFMPIKEYNKYQFGQYQESCFEPLVKQEALEAELEEIFHQKHLN